ncbi:MAG TPA: hypothetical protein VFG87_21375 [Amycolatopsis sp.]|nr:hypothetical protein [Amycolatopsis sp.]
MSRWKADVSASFVRRWGKSPAELGITDKTPTCPDLWELDNGDLAVIGMDLTEAYRDRLPARMSVGQDERLVVIPRKVLIMAKADIPDAGPRQ